MKSNLIQRGFLSLLFTQFFGAVNDNILKGILTFMVIDGAWAGRFGAGGQGVVFLCLTLPFILLSGYGGQFADRNSKQYVARLVKIIELPIALIGMVGFWTGNLWITMTALVALACQSTFFGPAKYGMIPELVAEGDLSRANGSINMMTNIAVITGMLLAGVISDRYNPLPRPDITTPTPLLWLPGIVMLIVAIAGLISVLFLPRLEPGDRTLRYNLNPLATYIAVFREMSHSPLLMVMLAWGYFYLLAGLALLIIPEYTVTLKPYQVDRAEASILLGVLGVSIGIGSVVAGLISGHRIQPRLIPIGAIGITVFFILLGIIPPSIPAMEPKIRVLFSSISGFIFGAGFFAGFYIIPLQAMLQKLSPEAERGRFLGTANGVSFAFLSLASLVYLMIRPWFGDHPERIFLVSAGMMIIGAAYFLIRLRDSPLRFEASITADVKRK